MNILNTKHEHLSQSVTHQSEMSFHLILSEKPLINTYLFIFENTSQNIDEAEMITFLEIDVLEVVVFWQHVAATALLQEVHMGHLVTLEVNVLVVNNHLGLEKRTDPGNKRARFFKKKV